MIDRDDAFQPARNALADVKSSHEVQQAAIDMLDESADWRDIATVREWRARQFAGVGAEIQPDYLPDALGFDRPATFNLGSQYPEFVPDFGGDFYAIIVFWAALIATIGVIIGVALVRSGVL